MPQKMPKHIFRMFFLLAFFVLLFFAAKVYLTDPSFYRFGDYRADAVVELTTGEPLFMGSEYCQSCHPERLADWSVNAHRAVQCEVCHGASLEHPDDGKTLIPVDRIRLCTTCHEALPARPAHHPQIVLAEHPFPDEQTPPCNDCHDPHIPGTGELDTNLPVTETRAAITGEVLTRAPAAVSKCAKCHGKLGEGQKQNPAIAGVDSAVFINQMEQYRSGARKHKIMAKYAKSLTAEEIVELAAYYESLPENSLNNAEHEEQRQEGETQ
jgi:cytochrome c553